MLRVVTVSIDESTLHLNVEGFDKVWAVKSSLDIPLEHVGGARLDPPEVHDWWKGLRLGGTQTPWLVAGTFLYHGTRVFWDVRNPANAVGIILHDERYSELIIEVENPCEVVAQIQSAVNNLL